MINQTSDNELINRYNAGEENALEMLIERYLGMVYRFTLRYVGSPHDAEDLAQEVFVKLWRSIKRFDTTKPFTPWLFRIARNTVFDFFKKKKEVPFSAFEDAQENFILLLRDTGHNPEEFLEKEEIASALAPVLKQLSPAHQTVLSLHYNKQHTFQEIADMLSEPLHTVKSRHRRALIKLKKFLPGNN